MHGAAIHVYAGFVLAVAAMASPTRGIEPSVCDPETWQAEIAAFETADAADPPPQDAVLFVGSSSIRLWDTARWFPELPTINRGFGGSQICDSTHFADVLIVKHRPRMIVFYAGDNDVASGKSAEQVRVDFREFVAKVRESLPETPVVYISIKPSIARWKLRDVMQEANRLISAEGDADDTLQFVDMWPAMLGDDGQPRKDIFLDDGLHLNDAGYKLWADLLQPLLAVP
jgi:lysophospholipase L1-like esterase